MTPQAAPVSPAAAPEKPKGAVGIWLGILLIIGGIVLGIVLVISGARSLFDNFDELQRVPVNGGGVVRIEDTGEQTIYAERPSIGSGSSFNTGTTFGGYGPDIAVRVIGPDGQDIPVRSSSGTETYTFDDREGVEIGTFQASTEGTYRLVTRPQDGSTGNWNTVAVGQGLEFAGIGVILGGVFGGGLVVLIGIVLVIVFAVRRSRSKKRIAQASAPYPGAYGGAAGWPAAPGYTPPGAGYGAPPAPAGAAPGWATPPVAPPVQQGAGPSWASPPPAPQAPQGPTWQPAAPAAAPEQPTWQPPPAPAPDAAPQEPTWQPPASDVPPAPEAPAADSSTWSPPPPPSEPPSWQPPADSEAPAPAPPPADPLAPPWQPPSSGGDGPGSS